MPIIAMEDVHNWSETQDHGSSVGPGPPATPDDPAAIGRYRVIRRLGQGGFGRVYLARDEDLDRPVAIKVPNPGRIAGPGDVETYINEARALARLDHAHIVPVYDVGRTADGHCFVVSKYIDGSDLAARIAAARPSPRESAELVATVAEALHHAHTRGLVHRDIKPANILIDAAGAPWVADFGLALKDEDYGKGARLAGTPAYMSPEQARGEGHRVDGRSDLFSLGVVLYELLTGRKPFRGDNRADVMDQIAAAEPRPPRQIDDTLPRELERICLKALSKRASERFSTGRDMAEDVHHFLRTELPTSPITPPTPPPSTVAATPAPTPPTHDSTPTTPVPVTSDSEGRAVRIIPKGLRSFDRHDAGFFLELLPGPRDREGLPETLRFWKTRIESTDPDATFKVGLIYGPSGCGKSSMVKAGLLPRLNKDVLTVYIEATPEETEARLLRGLRKACPDLDTGLDLVDTMAAIRRGRVLRPGQKVLLVLDQFEQWLFARRGQADAELVAALRQCDGDHAQALVMVRDDFWMAATRFMRDLEVRIVEGENSAAVDLFDLLHARRVLAAFGRAYGVLPEKSSELTPDQRAFLEQSVAGLANEGKVISVRLALFAEMVKGKPWTTATLRDVGGARGIGVTFLEETFSAATAPPEHRLHQRAAQGILRALLPGTGADIKGQMRSEADLRDAAGYALHPRDFDDVINILDRELRLITPTDPEGSGGDATTAVAGGRFYQLTHDYLVPSLREWLTRKQRETRRGRAELRLAARAAIWEARPEGRHLPSPAEWLSIRALTRPRDWTAPQRAMMRRAGRAHGLRAIAAAIGIIGLAAVGLEVGNRIAAERTSAAASARDAAEARRHADADAAAGRLKQLLEADTADVAAMIPAIADDRRWIDADLRRVAADPLVNPRARLHASLALLPTDPGQLAYLEERLPKAGTPEEAGVLRETLRPHAAELAPKLWARLESADCLAIAAALALFDPENRQWPNHAAAVADALVQKGPPDPWLGLLRPLRKHLTSPLAAIFRDPKRAADHRERAVGCLVDYARDDPGLLAALLMDADPPAFAAIFPVAAGHADAVAQALRAELRRVVGPDEPTIDPSWPSPEPSLVKAIEAADGLVTDRFAVCQSLPMAEAQKVVEGMRAARYRPTRFRPYADGPSVKVAAVWTRDARRWKIATDLSREETTRLDAENRADRLDPIDVAGYLADGGGRPVVRYAAIWAEADEGDDSRMFVGIGADEDPAAGPGKPKMSPRTLQVLRAPDDRLRISGVLGKGAAAEAARDLFENDLAAIRARQDDAVFLDLSVGEPSAPEPAREAAKKSLERAERMLRARPGNLEGKRIRGQAALRLGDPARALDDLRALAGREKDETEGLPYRAIARARLSLKDEAMADLRALETAYVPTSFKQSIAAVVAAELGDDDPPALSALKKAIAAAPDDPDVHLDAARAFAMASAPVGRRDPAKGRRLAERALVLLKELADSGAAEFGKIRDDSAFDPIRGSPEFAAIFAPGHPDRRYTAVWSGEIDAEAVTIQGLAPRDHMHRASELAKQGFRPVAWTAARTSADGPIVTASAWLRLNAPEDARERLAARQARAAAAMIRLGLGDKVWPLLRHGPDPRLRSALLDALNRLGVAPKAVADELIRLDGTPRPEADGVLFDGPTSMRRALILALGTYDAASLPAPEREKIADTLLRLYRDDPDAGIHGAAGLTLRRWGQSDRLARVDADFRGLHDPGERRWSINGQGQTFTIIDGPSAFRIGSTAADPDRKKAIEVPRRVAIPRRYAIAATEVTTSQFRRFSDAHDEYRSALPDPRPDVPVVGVTWYAAAAYCNWLSEQERLPRDQWCYLPDANGLYAEGMTVPADVLERTGYRLPTEPEWEYACRAGAMTSRYYGASVDLLERYAWYVLRNDDRARPCGGLLPNDFGLFDMLGNVYEWSHDCQRTSRAVRGGVIRDAGAIEEMVLGRRMRMLRSGSFETSPDEVRSAERSADLPTYQSHSAGFRLVRTLKGPP